MREVILIAAVGPNFLIGDGLRLPWRLPRDFRLFRRLTANHPIIMGRKTFESLNSKPLPKRRNIVVSRNSNFEAKGCELAASVEEAISLIPDNARVFVIGGGQIYQQAMPLATSIVLTEIFDENPNKSLFNLFSGDIFFPEIPLEEWTETSSSKNSYLAISKVSGHQLVKRKGLRFRVRRFIKKDLVIPSRTRLFDSEIKQSLAISRDKKEESAEKPQKPLFE